MRNRRHLLLILLTLLGALANAQWTVVNLHPAGATSSYADGVSAGQQVGSAQVDGHGHASLWSGTAASWMSLHPVTTNWSSAHGVGGGQQVGQVWTNACLWSGTPASEVVLSGPYANGSHAFGVSGGQQVGMIRVGGDNPRDRASLWAGTTASWVSLHPEVATHSYAYGVGGGQQVGSTVQDGVYHASLWAGTAASWVDLHPTGASESAAVSVSGGQQVGYAHVGGTYRASLWMGTAASWLSLHPAGSTESEAYGVSGGQQVGSANVGGVTHASLWSGTAASWVDLHSFLPANFSSSVAKGIWRDATGTYVVGSGWNTTTWRQEALMWKRPLGSETSGNTGGDIGYRELRGFASGKRPIILVNGISASFLQGFFEGFLGGPGGAEQWTGFVYNFVSAYTDLGFSRYDPQTNPNGLIFVCDILDTRLSLWENARRLNSFIESKRNLPQFQSSPKFDIVGYSFGGLIARQWEHDFDSGRELYAYSPNAKRLRNLVTISTPHQGTPLANLWGWGGQESIPEMTTWAMEAYNKTFTSHLGTRYSRIAGDVDKWWLLLGKHHDRVIKVASQTASDWIKAGSGVSGDTQVLPGLSHCDPLGLWDDIRDAPQTATAVYESIYGGGGALGPQDQENQEPEVHDSLETVANLKPNASINRYVSTPMGAGTLGINVSWADGDATVVAVEPGGRLINPTVAASDPNIDYEKEGNAAAYVIRTPKSGLWAVRATGAANVPAGGTECRMSASDQFAAEALATTPVLVRLGSTGRILVSLEDSNGNLTGGVVEASVLSPAGSTSSLSFFDDGSHGDGIASDGLYGSNFVATNYIGTYAVSGRITGTRTYGTVSRLFATSFDSSSETARIVGLVGVAASDDPGDPDTYYDFLRVSVKSNFLATGTFMLSADLVGPQGQFVDHVTEVIEPSTTGVLTTELKFHGQVIGEAMLDGPYTIRNVRLTDQTGPSVLTDYKASIGVTAAYSKLKFETITARTASPTNHFDGTGLISLPLDIADPAVTIKTILGPNVYFPGPWQGNRLRGMAIKVAWKGARPSVASYLGSEDDTEFPIMFEKAGVQTVGCPYNRPLPISRFYVKNVTTGEVRTSTADAENTAPWVSWSFSYQQAGVWKLAKLSGGNDTKLRPWFGYRFSTNAPNLEITFRD